MLISYQKFLYLTVLLIFVAGCENAEVAPPKTNSYDSEKVANEFANDLDSIFRINDNLFMWDENKIDETILNERIDYFENKYLEIEGETEKFYDITAEFFWCMEPNFETIQMAESGQEPKCNKEWNKIGSINGPTEVRKTIDLKNNSMSGYGELHLNVDYIYQTPGSIISFGD